MTRLSALLLLASLTVSPSRRGLPGQGVQGALTEQDYEEIGKEIARRKLMSGRSTDDPPEAEKRRLSEEGAADPRINRTAVILSGQMRSANLTWSGGQIRRNREAVMFGNLDPPTPAECIIEWIFKPLARQSGIDVFMYLTANPNGKPGEWNGQPLYFDPAPGDTTACEVFSRASLFHDGSGNRFFCLIEPEVQLMTPWLRNFSMWHHRPGGYNSELYNEQALQQYYGHYRANTAAKQYAISHHIIYKYKVRLRPDTPPSRVMPNLTYFNFGPTPGKPCKSTVFYPNAKVGGHNDWFNVGLTADMDRLLDRYVDFTTTVFDKWLTRRNYWDLEDHLEAVLMLNYEICLEWAVELWIVVIRPVQHFVDRWKATPIQYNWVELSTGS